MKITRHQLRKIIREAIDVLNNETGELLIFDDVGEVSADGHTIGADAPEAAARDILRRLQITPIDSEIDGDIETIEVSPEDWAVMDVELRGKRRYRKNKREQERLDIDNLRGRLDQWAANASSDYGGDNPDVDMQDVAWDLAAAAKYEFKEDEWDELVWEMDNDEDELITYIADMIA